MLKDNASLFASIVTIFGVILIFLQLQLTNQQLKELKANAQIDIELILATSTISVGPTKSEPFSFFVTAHNSGSFTPSLWRASLLFCSGVEVVEADNKWRNGDGPWYFLESQKPLIPHLMIHATAIDAVGAFRISLPTKDNANLDRIIPITIVYASGERSESTAKLVSLSKAGLIYENFETQDGRIISDLRGCWDVRE